MDREINAAVAFIAKVALKNVEVTPVQVDKFKRSLTLSLHDKCRDHWFPDKPYKGQAYRCIRQNGITPPDPILVSAALDSEIAYDTLNLPIELTIWIDPYEVSYRFGEDNTLPSSVATFNVEPLPNCEEFIPQPWNHKQDYMGKNSMVLPPYHDQLDDPVRLPLSPSVPICAPNKSVSPYGLLVPGDNFYSHEFLVPPPYHGQLDKMICLPMPPGIRVHAPTKSVPPFGLPVPRDIVQTHGMKHHGGNAQDTSPDVHSPGVVNQEPGMQKCGREAIVNQSLSCSALYPVAAN